MKKITLGLFSILFLFTLMAAQPAQGPELPGTIEIEVQVSPQTILLGRLPPSGSSGNVWVTIHTNIDLSIVKRTTVMLDVVQAEATFADNHGDLVAKFYYEDIADLLDGETWVTLTLVLTGETVAGDDFTGKDTVRVVRMK